MTRLRDRAHAAYAPYRHGLHPASLAARNTVDNDDEELKILVGKTNIVSAQLQASSLIPSSSLGTQSYSDHYRGSSGSPLQTPPMNHLDSVHPSLMQYIAETPGVSDYHTEQRRKEAVIPASRPVEVSGLRLAPLRPQHTESYSQQQYSTMVTPVQPEYYPVYTPYTPNAAPVASSSLAGALHRSNSSSHPLELKRPEPHTPVEQDQHATWQVYMEQLGLP